MKKVLCLIDRLGYGGAERQIIGLAVLLKGKGYNVELATYYDFDFSTDSLDNCNIKMIRLKQRNNPLSKLIAVKKIIKEQKYDVVIAYKIGAAMLACIIKMLGGSFKLIVSERNTTQKIDLREKIRFWLFKFSDFVVPNSYTQENYIKQRYPSLRKKTYTITNFTDVDTFKPAGPCRNEQIVVMTTARITEQKNVLNYLEAVKLAKEKNNKIRFRWYGNFQSGREDYVRDCKQKIKELGIGDVFTFIPATNKIEDEYQKCDIFCLPSVYEGYPNVICEAMSSGKPILCSRVCDNPYIVEEEKGGLLFNPNDIYDIAKALERICEKSREDLLIMGQYNRRESLNKFSKKTFVEKYIKIIEN